MGMFDYVKYEGPLPKDMPFSKSVIRIAMQTELPQSKSLRLWDNPMFTYDAYNNGCVTAQVDAMGFLRDPNGDRMQWSGNMRFYGGGHRCKRYEIEARVNNGIVIGVKWVNV